MATPHLNNCEDQAGQRVALLRPFDLIDHGTEGFQCRDRGARVSESHD